MNGWYTIAHVAELKKVANQIPPVWGFDCVNLTKGILWGWIGDPNDIYGGARYCTNGVPDTNANGMIGRCKEVSTDFSHIEVSITANAFDYIPLNDIFTNIPKLIFHNLYNFALVLIPLLAAFIFCIIFLKNRKKLFAKSHLAHLSPTTTNLILVFAAFIIIHILGASLIKSPPRLLIPAYLAGLIITFRILLPHLKLNAILTTIITTATFLVVAIHGILLTKYHFEMSKVLENIQNSEEPIICINPEETKPTRIPVIDLSQANIIVDWGQPEPIYDKQIISCK